ncbi:MAG: glycine/sarcosine/betaine reductase selenoprotein B family protein [Candidatus Binatia bacterium]
MSVDSYRWLPRSIAGFYKRMHVVREEPIPWTPLTKPLAACRVAAVTTAGLYVRGQEPPFDMERERREPTWGDPTYRIIPSSVRQEEFGACHLHINNDDLLADVNIALPVHRLNALAQDGEIGSAAPRHFSFMGFQMDNTAWRERYAPEVAQHLREDAVDCVLLTPV